MKKIITLLSVFLFFFSLHGIHAQTNPLLGTWRSDPYQFTAGTMAEDVLILFPNGTYQTSTMSASGQCILSQKGTYTLQSNTVNLMLKDYEPKEFQEKPIHMPGSESFAFAFLDKNTFRKTNASGAVIVHRVTGP